MYLKREAVCIGADHGKFVRRVENDDKFEGRTRGWVLDVVSFIPPSAASRTPFLGRA